MKVNSNNNADYKTETFNLYQFGFKEYLNNPVKIKEGVILTCDGGNADILVNLRNCHLEYRTQLILFPDDIIVATAISPDFVVSCFQFSQDILDNAKLRLMPKFFLFIREHFYCDLPEDAYDMNKHFYAILYNIQRDLSNIFRIDIVYMCLRSILLDIYDKTHKSFMQSKERYSREDQIFSQFTSLVINHYQENRKVQFYAQELCISTNYLTIITNKIKGYSAKMFIDNYTIMEIKILLQDSTIPLKKISGTLMFPDLSYFVRYFKHHAGVTPSEYRSYQRK